MVRGEIPNERGDSLFSPKSLEGERRRQLPEVEHWMGEGADCLPNPTKLRMPAGERGQLDGGR